MIKIWRIFGKKTDRKEDTPKLTGYDRLHHLNEELRATNDVDEKTYVAIRKILQGKIT